MSLDNYREQIDKIDDELLRLFTERMAVSRQVALYKKEHGLPVFNADREREVLSAAEEKTGEELQQYAIKLYTAILEISREYQEKILTGNERHSL